MQRQITSKTKESNSRQKRLIEKLRCLQTGEFIDEDFPHVYENIYDSSTSISHLEQVIWMPCEQLHHKPFYSKQFNLNDIRQMKFVSTTINNALIIIKFFAQKLFNDLTNQRQLNFQCQNRVYKHLNCFDVFLEKEIKKVWIDSFVPVSQVKNKELFSETLNGCIFPCLIEKLLAKVSHGYQNIHLLKVYEIVQIFTAYPIEKIRIKQLFVSGSIDQKQKISKLQQLITKVIEKNKSLVFFRTRKNPKLQLFGLKSNHAYFINKCINKSLQQSQLKGISFLQLPDKEQNEPKRHQWIGKLSKYRVQSQLHNAFQVQDKDLRGYENFMLLKDLIQVTKQLIILHNTTDCKTQFKVSQFLNYKSMTRSYLPQQGKNLIQKNQKLQIIQTNFLTQEQNKKQQQSVFKNNSIRKQSKENPYSKSELIDEVKQNKNHPQLFLVFDCLEIQLSNKDIIQDRNQALQIRDRNQALQIRDRNQALQIRDRNQALQISQVQNLLINIRLQQDCLHKEDPNISTNFGKCTLILCRHQQSNNDRRILMTQNSQVKLDTNKNLKYFDLFISLQSTEVGRISSSVSMMILLDGISTHKSIENLNMILKTTIFYNFSDWSSQNTISIQSMPQQKAFQGQIQKIMKQMLYSSQQDNFQNTNLKDAEVSIICKQFIDRINLGFIYIKSKNQQDYVENLKVPQKITLQVQINTDTMLKSGILLLQKIGQVQDFSFNSEESTLSYRIKLDKSSPEFMFVFRIHSLNQLISGSLNQPPTTLRFPPLNSIKVSRIFTANF